MTDKALAENDLEKLAARAESATGPDRELDVAILRAIDPTFPSDARPLPWERCFTSSLDAAMSLIPEEWTAWGIWSRNGKTRFYAILSRLRDDFDKDELDDEDDVRSRRCASPALALTAACLRATAHSGER